MIRVYPVGAWSDPGNATTGGVNMVMSVGTGLSLAHPPVTIT